MLAVGWHCPWGTVLQHCCAGWPLRLSEQALKCRVDASRGWRLLRCAPATDGGVRLQPRRRRSSLLLLRTEPRDRGWSELRVRPCKRREHAC